MASPYGPSLGLTSLLAIWLVVASLTATVAGSESTDPYVTLGCWRDTADRAIPTLEGTDPRLDNRYYPARQNPIEKCYLVAFDRGFRVFAVQDDGACMGSADAHNTYRKYGPSTACAADGEGGPWANEVYQITANVPEETTTFVNGTSETAPPTDVTNTTTAPVQHETVASVTSAVPEATIMTASRAQTGEPISTKASITSAAEDEGSESTDPYVSLGCWRDTADRAIPVLEGTDPRLDNRYYPARQNPIEKCYLVAFDRGFRVFAVQDDGQCFGSANAHNTYKKYGPSTACAADGEGGPWANEVYQITAPFEDICLGTTTCDRSAGASCRAWGDPHYISFDGTRTDFMGTCTYTLAERTEEPAFRVAAKNEHRYGRTHVSYISRVTVEVYAHRITVSRNNRVSVNDVPVTLPACIGNNVGVRMTGRDVLIYTDFCLRVTYDGNHDVNLEVPSDLIGQSRGMCGNFNGDRTDDRQLPDGNLTTSQAAFGDSWKVVNITDESCPVEDTPEITFDLSQADDALVQAIESTSQCGKMLDPSGPFGDCLEVVDPTDYYEACVFDMAFHEGTVPELLCESTQAYSDACVEKGVPQPSWRTDSFCPMQCPAMSEYAQCVSPCPATCADLQAAEKCSPTEPCVEGCRCLIGFVLSGDVCVPADACGCFTEGRYHSLNEEWSEGNQLCWCGQSRDIRCVQMSNAPEETTFVNGTSSEEAPPTDVTTTEATTTTAQPGRVSEEAFAMLECTGEYMQVVFSRSHIPEFDKDHLHLMDPSCKATGNATHIILTAPFDECGTVKTDTESEIIYFNKVLSADNDGVAFITRIRELEVPFECRMDSRDTVSAMFSPQIEKIYFFRSAHGKYNFDMQLFTSAGFQQQIDTFPYVVQLNQPLYVQVQVLTPDQDLQLFAENCMATPSANILDPMSYTFISDGCPVDSTFLSLFSSSQKQERFSINSFAFVEDYPEVYLHCTVMVCNATDPTSRCTQGCLPPPARHRRVALGAEPRYNVYKGPILYPAYRRPSDMDVAEEVEENRGARVPPGVVTSLVIAVGLLLCAVVTLVGVIAYMRMRTVRKELYTALPTDDLE